MASQVRLIVLLAVIALVSGNVIRSTIEESLDSSSTLTLNLDKIFDRLLPDIRKFIIENGMDPIRLINFSETIIPILPGRFKGNIDLVNGWMQELSKLERSKHITASYKNKLLVLNMDLGWKMTNFNYEYYLTYLLYKRHGDVYGRLHDLNSKVVVTIDLNNYHVRLDTLKFVKVRKIDFKFEGKFLDPILNAMTKVVTVIFRKSVLANIEKRAFTTTKMKLDEWNKMFPRPNRTMLIQKFLNNLDIPLY